MVIPARNNIIFVVFACCPTLDINVGLFRRKSSFGQAPIEHKTSRLWNQQTNGCKSIVNKISIAGNVLQKFLFSLQGCRDGAVVRALASHQCGSGSIPGLGVICGLSLLVLYSAPRGFLRALRFPLF